MNTRVISIINDLIKINNDRIAGYEKAAHNISDIVDVEVKTFLYQMAEESRNFAKSLASEVIALGGQPTNHTTASGKIYRLWMDLKATFTGGNIVNTLQSCEFGEASALNAYKLALKSLRSAPKNISKLVQSQCQWIDGYQNRLKLYRAEYMLKSAAEVNPVELVS